MREGRMLRPMEYGELFNEAFDLYKRNFFLFVGIGAVVYIPYYLLVSLGDILAVVGFLGFIIPLVAASGAIVKALADRYLGIEATISSSWRYVLRRLFPYLITSVLGILLIIGGTLLVCVPGVIMFFWTFFLWNVMIVEDRYYGDAIQRSRELAAGEWGRVFIVALMAILLYYGASCIVGFVAFIPLLLVYPGLLTGGAENVPLWASLVQGLLSGAVQSFLAPVTAVLSVLLYFDIRIRKEGFDIELLAQEMGAPSPGGGPPLAPE